MLPCSLSLVTRRIRNVTVSGWRRGTAPCIYSSMSTGEPPSRVTEPTESSQDLGSVRSLPAEQRPVRTVSQCASRHSFPQVAVFTPKSPRTAGSHVPAAQPGLLVRVVTLRNRLPATGYVNVTTVATRSWNTDAAPSVCKSGASEHRPRRQRATGGRSRIEGAGESRRRDGGRLRCLERSPAPS